MCVVLKTEPIPFNSHRTSYSCNSTGALEPIMSTLIVASEDATVLCPKYYSKIDVNLNEGTTGKFIYMCIIRGSSSERFGVPISDFFVTAGETPSNLCTSFGGTDSIRISQDLNDGNPSTSSYVYMCQERFGDQAVTNVTFAVNGSCPLDYEQSPVNLNSGTGHNTTIFMCVQKKCDLTLTFPSFLTFRADKTFKIAQLTDSHFGEYYDGDILTASSVFRTVLLHEDPDVVALTGDQVNKYPNNLKYRSVYINLNIYDLFSHCKSICPGFWICMGLRD